MAEFLAFISFLLIVIPLFVAASKLTDCHRRLTEIRDLLKAANIHHDITSTSTDRLADFFHSRNVKVDHGPGDQGSV
jgi:hypothetical protein